MLYGRVCVCVLAGDGIARLMYAVMPSRAEIPCRQVSLGALLATVFAGFMSLSIPKGEDGEEPALKSETWDIHAARGRIGANEASLI